MTITQAAELRVKWKQRIIQYPVSTSTWSWNCLAAARRASITALSAVNRFCINTNNLFHIYPVKSEPRGWSWAELCRSAEPTYGVSSTYPVSSLVTFSAESNLGPGSQSAHQRAPHRLGINPRFLLSYDSRLISWPTCGNTPEAIPRLRLLRWNMPFASRNGIGGMQNWTF